MRKSHSDDIKFFRIHNPSATKIQCMKALSLSFPTVNKYWEDCGMPNYYQLKKQMVEDWCRSNPKGIKADCVYDLKLSFPTVNKYWINKSNKKSKPVKINKEINKTVQKPEPNKIAENIEKVRLDDSFLYEQNSLFDL